MMRQHEPETLSSGKIRCKHCGSAWANDMGISCIDRHDPSAPPSGRRISALDDVEAMYARLTELRRERDEALNAPDPEAKLYDVMDDCCG